MYHMGPNTGVPEYTKQIVVELYKETDGSIIMVGSFNSILSLMLESSK